ncbi:MAG: hypothetical protein ACYDHH_20405 [Solirubrobacteraceae bacterium]
MSRAHVTLQSGQRCLAALRRAPLVLAAVCIFIGCQTSAALAAAAPSVPKGFKITKLASSPKGVGNCDDLAYLAGHLFVGCQNKTLSNGGGGNSTLIEYTTSGKVVKTWTIKDKIDGMAADPLKHYVIITLDEDASSHLATIDPSAPAAQQVTNYAYSPDPRGASTPTALRTGGGTDQVSVDSAGHILITGSHAGTSTGTAVFKVALTPPGSPTATGTATLSPTFLDNATATNGGTGTGTTKLALGDVDSGAIVPQSSPLYGGSYVITDQTALELVFAKDIWNGTGLTVLKTPFGLDDLLWTTSPHGTLYVVDKGPVLALPKVPVGALYKVTGPFTKNMVLAANDGVGSQVVSVDLSNGKLTPFIQGLLTSKGLAYVDPSGTQTPLTLNGNPASTPATTTSTTPTATTPTTTAPAATPTTTTPAATAKAHKKSDSHTLLIVLVIVGVALLVALAFVVNRFGKPSS